MAGSLNRVSLLGNVGKDPEIRSMNNGGKVASFSIATSESWKDRDGNKQERTDWHNVVVFSEGLVRVIEQYVHKGSKLFVEGKLQTRKWQDQSGSDRYTTEIVLQPFGSQLILLDRKEGGGSGGGGGYSDQGGGYSGGGGQQGGGYSSGGQRPQPAAFDTDLDDDVPF